VAEACYPPGLLGVDDAIARMVALARTRRLETETVTLAQAAGRVVATDIIAGMDVPPQANSAMDGFAFCHADLQAVPTPTLRISQRIPAGQAPAALEKGTAARIFTGAILPDGADSVVMQENCHFDAASVTLDAVPERGANVRPAGQDVARGSVVLAAGERISPQALGLLASTGLSSVSVFRKLRVAVLSTGDELLEPGEPWRAAAIYNSNRPMLSALLAGWGCEMLDLGRVADSVDATEVAFESALAEGVDVIVSSGGVSVGEEDHVKAALQKKGRLDFWKIAIKPGKPVAIGKIGDADFIGLPGNPQSVFVTALLLARPFLLARMGQGRVLPPAFLLPAAFTRKKVADRREYLRVQLQACEAGARLLPHSQQSSGALLSAVWADGLALLEAGVTVEEGALLPFLPFSTLAHP
jgi:molybdopterin molybdotransferase